MTASAKQFTAGDWIAIIVTGAGAVSRTVRGNRSI